MGQCLYSMPQWVKDKIEITGGYWSYKIINKANSKYKTDIWRNSKDELEQTLKEII